MRHSVRNKTNFWFFLGVLFVTIVVCITEFPLVTEAEQTLYVWTKLAAILIIFITGLRISDKHSGKSGYVIFAFAGFLYSAQGEYFRPLYVFAYSQWILVLALLSQQKFRDFIIVQMILAALFSYWIFFNFDKNLARLANPGFLSDQISTLIVALIIGVLIFKQINQARVEKDLANQKVLLVGQQTVNIIHDLKNLASAPLLYSELMTLKNRDKIDPDTKRILDNLNKDLIAMSEKTKDLYRMIQKPSIKLELEPVEQSLERALSFLSNRLKSVDISKTGFSDMTFPKGSLELVFLNLFYNSLDAWQRVSTAQPVLRVSLEKNQIVIQDNAGGVTEDLLKKFNNMNFQSSGLGLQLIAEACEALDLDVKMKNILLNNEKGLEIRLNLVKR